MLTLQHTFSSFTLLLIPSRRIFVKRWKAPGFIALVSRDFLSNDSFVYFPSCYIGEPVKLGSLTFEYSKQGLNITNHKVSLWQIPVGMCFFVYSLTRRSELVNSSSAWSMLCQLAPLHAHTPLWCIRLKIGKEIAFFLRIPYQPTSPRWLRIVLCMRGIRVSIVYF